MARVSPLGRAKKRLVTPMPTTEAEFLKAGRKREGTYTATETGAKYLAERGEQFREQRRILNAAKSTKEFEKKIRRRG